MGFIYCRHFINIDWNTAVIVPMLLHALVCDTGICPLSKNIATFVISTARISWKISRQNKGSAGWMEFTSKALPLHVWRQSSNRNTANRTDTIGTALKLEKTEV